MTTIKVDTITNAAGTGAPNIPDGVTIAGTALASINSMDYTASASEPTSPKNGAIWWDTGNSKFFQYMNGAWVEVSYTDLPPVWYGSRGVFSGTNDSTFSARMEYISIATPSNATSFGNLSANRWGAAACSNTTRGVFGGGLPYPIGNNPFNTIDYITIATTGNATDFGDLTLARTRLGACSDGVYGVFGGASTVGPTGLNSNVMDYITIATTGNATDFGDLLRAGSAGACSNSTYGLFIVEGISASAIQYITIATTGNATSFGNTVEVYGPYKAAACSNETYGVYVVGQQFSALEYVTINTPSNATDFGDLSVLIDYVNASCSDGTYGIFGGGYGDPSVDSGTNIIEYVSINTPGNATDFGDFTANMQDPCACSGD